MVNGSQTHAPVTTTDLTSPHHSRLHYPASLCRATPIEKAMHLLSLKQLIDHNLNSFKPLPNKTASPSTDHHIELDEFDMPDLYYHQPLEGLTTPTSDHPIKFDDSELPLRNPLAPSSPHHSIEFDFDIPP